VLLRLQRYAHAYDLSELRIYVGCFLLLVPVADGLLTVHVLRHKGLGWLLLTQPACHLRVVLRAAVPRCGETGRGVERRALGIDRNRTLDVDYLASLGTSAIPSLIRVGEMRDRAEAHQAFPIIQKRKPLAQASLAQVDWRSWQQHDVRNLRLLAIHEVRTQR
jgi:hypothetical protein